LNRYKYKRKREGEMVRCVICGKLNAQVHSAVFNGSVHTKCHDKWLAEIRKPKEQRRKIMARRESKMVEHISQTEAKAQAKVE